MESKPYERLLEQIKKLDALANSPEAPNPEGAARMRDNLLKKHGLTMDDLEDDKEEEFELPKRMTDSEKWLYTKICHNQGVDIWNKSRNGKLLYKFIPTTKARHAEIMAMFGFYKTVYNDDFSVFRLAFIKKHSLWDNTPGNSKVYWDDLSIEEQERRLRADSMAKNLHDASFRKQLGNGK